MRNSRNAWDMWSPHYGLMGYVQDTRGQVIHMFLSNCERECWPGPGQRLDSYNRKSLTALERRLWRRWQARGFKAVHVIVEVADYRVRAP